MSFRLLASVIAFLMFLGQPFLASAEPTGDPVSTTAENPFAAVDQARDIALQEMSGSVVEAATKDNASDIDVLLTALPDEGDRSFIIRFTDDCPLAEMAGYLEGENYTFLGYSTDRMIRLVTADINAFLTKAGSRIKYSETDDLMYEESILPSDLATEPFSRQADPIGEDSLAAPTDTYYAYQYQHDLLNIPEAWSVTYGTNDIVVAVIDSGVSRTHTDLPQSRILPGKNYLVGGTVTGDVRGHGTMVTGVIAATVDNTIGVAGICNAVTILPLQITSDYGNITESRLIQAIKDAADAGVRVINMSMGGPTSLAEEEAINYALSKNVILIASAGNNGYERLNYPASYDTVVSVASVNDYAEWSDFSTYNEMVDVAAPGEWIYTTNTSGSYSTPDGTSFSAPAVSGLAVLALTVNPSLTPATFQQILRSTATDVDAFGFDKYTGYGMADAYALVKAAANQTLTKYTVTFVADNGSTLGSRTIPTGQVVYEPWLPSMPGYNFLGWYKDAQYKTLYSFNSPVTSSFKLYARTQLSGVGNFVSRFYSLCLGRTADPTGLAYWCGQLESWEMSGADVAHGFVFSPEFIGAGKTNEQYIDILYQAFFNRAADPGGKTDWLAKLNSGLSRYYVLHGFTNSTEFKNLASSYGISVGSLTLTEPEDLYPETTKFVTRFYCECLGRTPDTTGLRDWVTSLQNGTRTGASVAYGFVFSAEFISRNVSNRSYVETLYRAFFNRPADTAGCDYWLNRMTAGASRRDVLAGFVNSAEFAQLCAQFNIQPGSL